eukprot:TRINITY_DN25245_c0_g1_i1.p1 TRINITY_DN25245_c0_g1~~TRINITY_DN25245_c0_g1_i1.p1  ORF type:complete len:362 (+),score=46.58 TRINITY_DN25245_c0_g1_i1:66-1151(+)
MLRRTIRRFNTSSSRVSTQIQAGKHTEPPKRLQKPIVPIRYMKQTQKEIPHDDDNSKGRILVGLSSITKAVSTGKFPTPIIHAVENSPALSSLPSSLPVNLFKSTSLLKSFTKEMFAISLYDSKSENMIIAEFPSEISFFASDIDFSPEENDQQSKPRLFLVIDGTVSDKAMSNTIMVALQYGVTCIVVDECEVHKYQVWSYMTKGTAQEMSILGVPSVWKWIQSQHRSKRIDFIGIKNTPAGSGEAARLFRGPRVPQVDKPWGVIMGLQETRERMIASKTHQDILCYCTSVMKIIPANDGFFPFDVAAAMALSSSRQAIDAIDFSKPLISDDDEEPLHDPFLSKMPSPDTEHRKVDPPLE